MKRATPITGPTLLAGFCFALALALAGPVSAEGPAPSSASPTAPKPSAPEPAPHGLSLKGQLLVATRRIGDPHFAHTVIYMVAHDRSGALGLVVNRVYGEGPLDKFLKGFDIEVEHATGDIRLYYGGPVEPGVGFVLHTADYDGPGTRVVDGKLALTTEMGVLKDIAEGHGPRRALFMLGYAGWGPGQLEGEIERGDWLSAPADEAIIFDDDVETKWDRATGKAGLNL